MTHEHEDNTIVAVRLNEDTTLVDVKLASGEIVQEHRSVIEELFTGEAIELTSEWSTL